VSKLQLTNAELSFLGTLTGTKPSFEKAAVDLDPQTQQLLGISGAPPDALDQLEQEAGGPPAPSPVDMAAVDPEPEPELTPEPEIVSVDENAIPPSEDLEPVPETGIEEEDELPQQPEVVPSRSTHGKIFSSRRTHPLRLYDVLNSRYNKKWVTWEPETLWWAIRRDFGPVGDLTRNKIQALRTALVTDLPWGDWDVFEDCGLAWNDITPIFGAFQPMSPMQTAFAVSILQALRPDAPFDHEVSAYIAALLEDNGFVFAPEEWFPGAQALIDRKEWLAGLKVTITETWDKLQQADWSKVDWRSDHPIDIHIAKLLAVKAYLDGRAAARSGIPAEERSAVVSTPTSPPVP